MPSKSARERAARAAAQLAEQKKREQRRRYLSIGGVVLAMVVIVALGVWIGSKKSTDNGGVSGAPAAGKSAYGMAIGDIGAPHQVIVYEDFLCPICGAFEKEGHDQLAQLAAAGKVYVEYRPFQLRPEWTYSRDALNAFEVVRKTAGDDVAKKFHDLLYANQPDETGPWPGASTLVDLAVQAGADRSKVEKDILDTSSQKSYVDGATKEAVDAGVQSTPTILLDGSYYQKGTDGASYADNLIKDLS